MHERFGLDLDSGVLEQRNWRWLSLRIVGLLTTESRLRAVLYPPDKKT